MRLTTVAALLLSLTACGEGEDDLITQEAMISVCNNVAVPRFFKVTRTSPGDREVIPGIWEIGARQQKDLPVLTVAPGYSLSLEFVVHHTYGAQLVHREYTVPRTANRVKCTFEYREQHGPQGGFSCEPAAD